MTVEDGSEKEVRFPRVGCASRRHGGHFELLEPSGEAAISPLLRDRGPACTT